MLARTESSLSVTLHRFYLNESKAVKFSSTDDSLLILSLILTSFIITHGLYLVFHMLLPNPIGKKDAGAVWDVFLTENSTLVGVLLGAWMAGYCFVSWTVWHQFEAREGRSADDYVMLNCDPDDEDDDEEQEEKKVPETRIELEVVPSAMIYLPNSTMGVLYNPVKK